MKEEYFAGKFGFEEWSQKCTNLLIKGGMTRQIMESIMEKHMHLVDGVPQLFSELKERCISIAIISGGMKNAYEFLSERHGIKADYTSICTELFFDKDGKLEKQKTVSMDYERKVLAMERICAKAGISMKECAFVGDGLNDIYLFREVGLPIAIHPIDPKVSEEAKYTIKSSIMEVLDILE
jgi:phosphoserine phosphatase